MRDVNVLILVTATCAGEVLWFYTSCELVARLHSHSYHLEYFKFACHYQNLFILPLFCWFVVWVFWGFVVWWVFFWGGGGNLVFFLHLKSMQIKDPAA